jgi:polar amino acid transport system substrate-binding protein
MRAAEIVLLPAMPSDAEAAAIIERGVVHAWAANRQRMAEIARTSAGVRLLGDNFLMVGQAMIVPKGEVVRLADLNRFVEDLRASEFVKASIDRAGLTGNVEAAPGRTGAR